jgi:peptidoglycan/xylan/chitin deacetylase (PgdA/CDA1 family)
MVVESRCAAVIREELDSRHERRTIRFPLRRTHTLAGTNEDRRWIVWSVYDTRTRARPGVADVPAASAGRIAITIDDLPWNGPLPADGLEAATDRLIAALVEHDAPAVGFVRCAGLSETGGELRPWLDRGMVLGNHSTGHRDLNSAPLDVWLDDVRSCDAALRAATGAPVRYFRYPMLHQGPTAERRDAALGLLDELGYEIAHVTVDNSEYLLGRPFDAALAAGDGAEQARLGGLFVEHIMAMVRHAQDVALRKVGRDVDHILLLHANALAAYNVADLLGALAGAGFEFITLEEALRDPVYDLPDAYMGRKGLSWLYRIDPLSPADVEWDDAEAERLRGFLEGGD